MFTHDNAMLLLDWVMVTFIGFLVVALAVAAVTYYVWIVRQHLKTTCNNEAIECLDKAVHNLERAPLFSERNGYEPFDRSYALLMIKSAKIKLENR